jgi:hypothetical protein
VGAIDHIDSGEIRKLVGRIERLERGAPTGFSSITRGTLRVGGSASQVFDSSGTLTINGTCNGSGAWTWTGTSTLNGPVNIAGTQTITGTMNVNGPWNLSGTGGITGAVSCTGNWTWTGQLLINAGGSLRVAGSLPLTVGVTSNGKPGIEFSGGILSSAADRIAMTSASAVVGAANTFAAVAFGSNSIVVSSTGIAVTGNFTASGGTKSFREPHPTKEGMWLQHGATESPVSGTEYWGEGTVGRNGLAVIALPDYFEALNKPEGRIVIVSPVGRPFAVGADRITDGAFTVYGDTGREFTWCVKAERFGADFDVESIAQPEPDLWGADPSVLGAEGVDS